MKVTLYILLIVFLFACSTGVQKNINLKSTGSEVSGHFDQLPDSIAMLGEALFNDPILSLDHTVACASCHLEAFAFADTARFSLGVGGRLGARNTPSITNMSDRPFFFYDGRAATLEDQVHFPIEDPNEMSLPMDSVVQRLRDHKKYVAWFKIVFKKAPNKKNTAEALAAFERTLETSDTRYDDFANSEEEEGLTPSELRGREIFNDPKSRCFDCHSGGDFTIDEFRNIGLYDGVLRTDLGRFNVTGDSADIGKFKVPGLRNVGLTAPYMHDGSFKTLKEVLDYYNNPYDFVTNPINIDTLLLEPLGLSEQEVLDLENFLHTLTDRRFLSQEE